MEGVRELVQYMMVDVFLFVMEGVLVVSASAAPLSVSVHVVLAAVRWVAMRWQGMFQLALSL